MTKNAQKTREQFYAEQCAKFVGEEWVLGNDRENPDFIITCDGQQFGLEVTELFTGQSDRRGSVRKRGERHRQARLNALRYAYEEAGGVTLRVKLLGDFSDANLATVVPTLLSANLHGKPLLHQEEFELESGFRIFATRSLRPDWFYIGDSGGWVNQRPASVIETAIQQKSAKVATYVANCGPDVRLLLYCERRWNSGKLHLVNPLTPDLKGFSRVYFLSHPDSVATFS